MRTCRRAIASAILIVLSGAGAAAQSRIDEPAGGFRYTIPRGWQVRSLPSITQYKVCVGPAANGFAPNINVLTESFHGPLPEYVRRALDYAASKLSEFKKVSQGPFKTTAGMAGIRAVTTSHQRDRDIRQVFYFFPGKGNVKYVVTASALAADGEKLDSAFDGSLKTFTLR